MRKTNFGQKLVSSSLIAALLLQAAALPALAGPPRHPIAHPAPVTPVAQPAPVVVPPFQAMVQDYIRAYQTDDRLHKVIFASRIKKAIFADPKDPAYVDNLQYIDSQVATSPEAVYDLAKSLQLHWEAQYAVGLGHKQQLRFNTGAKIGAIIGITALGIAMFYHPERAPKYFQLMRQALPVAGLVAGGAAAHGLNMSGMLDKDVPLSPAHVMHLGINTEEFHYEDDTFFRDAVAVGVGIAAAMMFVRVIKWVNAAATPAKVNPLVLIGSIILSFVVEHEVRQGIDDYQFWKLKSKVLDSVSTVDQGLSAGDDGQVFTGADALVKTSVNLSSFLNRSLYQAISDYSANVSKAAEKYGEGSEEFQNQLNSYTEQLTKDVRDAMGEQEYTQDNDYDGFMVRNFLVANPTAAIDQLDADAQTRARSYLQGFDGWLAFQEDQVRNCVGMEERDRYFHQYIQSLNDSKDRKLVSELRSGNIGHQANHMLLESAALLRSTGLEYVQDHAEFLMSFIARNELMATTTAPPETPVRPTPIDLDGGLPPGGVPNDPADGGVGPAPWDGTDGVRP